MGWVGNGTITSRASEGVRDGSASKIGVVSGEAIWSKLATTSKVWWKTDLIDPGTNSPWPNGLLPTARSRVRFLVWWQLLFRL